MEEAEEELMLELNRRVSADLPLTPAETEAWRRWILPPRQRRRKKRKKRLPRTCGRARHRQRQWHAPCWYSVFPSCVGRPKLPGIIVGMVQDDSLLRSSSTPAEASAWLVMQVFLLALCSYAPIGQLCALFWQWHVQGSFCWYFALLAVFLLCSGPDALSAGPPLGLASWMVWTRGTVTWLVWFRLQQTGLSAVAVHRGRRGSSPWSC